MKKDHSAALKRFPIVHFLAKCNLVEVHGNGRERYYLSPLREERTASFAVNTRKNCWFDHGLGVGGNLLDLAMRLWGMAYKEAAEALAQLVACPEAYDDADALGRARNFGPPVAAPHAGRTVREAGELRDGVLRAYLVSRGISVEALQADGRVWSQLREVRYTQAGKYAPNGALRTYFAIGLVNVSQGLEIAARGFQSHLGAKDVTFIPGRQPGVAVFEGMMDFFSALTLRRQRHKGQAAAFQCAVLVLHSVTLAKKSLPLLAKAGGSLFYYGDNDRAGLDLQAFYQAHCRQYGAGFYAQNEGYRGYKDLNDFLCKKAPAKPLPARGQAPSARAETAKWWLWVVFRRPQGGGDLQRTFYAHNNTPAGRAALRALRARRAGQAVLSRLCERVGNGRQFRYEQQVHGGGAHLAAPPPPPRCATLPAGNPGSWGRA